MRNNSELKAGYGRARLWLGISGVGTFVVLSAVALFVGFPATLENWLGDSASGRAVAIMLFFSLYAAVHAPFDVFGGYVLPRRFGRPHPTPTRFVRRWLRGIVLHTTVLSITGIVMLIAGHQLGVFGVVGGGVLLSVGLLAVRRPLASAFAPIHRHGGMDMTAGENGPRVAPVHSDDQGFTGGFIGVRRPRAILLPARWQERLGEEGVELVIERRRLAVRTGSWLRGRILALVFTWVGIALCAAFVGPTRLGTAEGIISLSLWFTLWSFIGLLALPTPSRAGVMEVDRALRRSGQDEGILRKVVQQLDQLQDGEAERPRAVEAIFHPVPAVDNRRDGDGSLQRIGFIDAARTAVFVSASGLGLLGRAVHCNCGRPDLWVFLPSD